MYCIIFTWKDNYTNKVNEICLKQIIIIKKEKKECFYNIKNSFHTYVFNYFYVDFNLSRIPPDS